MSLRDSISNDFKMGSPVTRLIMINVAVFLCLNVILHLILSAIYGDVDHQNSYYSQFMHTLSLPYKASDLLIKPWSLLTYMFIHAGEWHIFWNMVFLYWFGNILMDVVGSKKIIPIYIMGGVAGAILFLIAAPLIAKYPELPLVGASGGIVAIIMAAATLAPHYRIFVMFIGPVKIIYIALIGLVTFVMGLNSGNAGGQLAHLGGAIFGYLYIKLYQNGTDLSDYFERFITRPIGRIFSFGRKPSPRVTYRNPARARATASNQGHFYSNEKDNSDTNAPTEKARINQERVNAILDKIRLSGYNNLTEEEKDYLFRASKEL